MISFIRTLLLVAIGTFFLAACGVDGSSDEDSNQPTPDASSEDSGGDSQPVTDSPSAGFDPVSMITQIVDEVIIKHYQTLSENASSFSVGEESIATYCNAIGTDQETTRREIVQDQWRSLMADVQATELHVVGPAADNGGALRNRLHSYSEGPLSTCGVDLSVVLAEDDSFDIKTRSLNQRGMGAVEYLLFNPVLDHTCAPQVPETQSWNSRSDSERRLKRCELATRIVTDVADAASTIESDWQDFRAEFINQDNAGDSLQRLTDGLFALDKLTKDQKLTLPTGLSGDCSALTCPKLVESPYAENTYQNIRANLLSFRKIFTGIDGLGFDDYIDNEGFPEVSERFLDNIVATLAVIDIADASVNTEVASIQTVAHETACTNAAAAPDQPNQLNVCRLAGSIKRITDDLKIDFVTIVGVMIPDSAQSDND